MILTSNAFKEGEYIPTKYTCDGQDMSPQLEWNDPPPGTKSFAMIVDDPTAPGGVFNHWVIFNIPVSVRKLAEATPKKPQIPEGTLQGKNDFGDIGYGGPCPPPGKPHQYQFTLYTLDKILDLKAGASRKQLLDAMKGHILVEAKLTGIYKRA